MEGITAIHFASCITLSGIALSGTAMISFRTLADASRRFSISDWSLSSADQAKLARSRRPEPSTKRFLGIVELKLFISEPLPCSKRATILDSYEHHRSFAVIFIPSGSTCNVAGCAPEATRDIRVTTGPLLEFLNLNLQFRQYGG